MQKQLKNLKIPEKKTVNKDKNEDLKDIEEIKRQKAELKKTNEKMSAWEIGKGVVKKESKKNV